MKSLLVKMACSLLGFVIGAGLFLLAIVLVVQPLGRNWPGCPDGLVLAVFLIVAPMCFFVGGFVTGLLQPPHRMPLPLLMLLSPGLWLLLGAPLARRGDLALLACPAACGLITSCMGVLIGAAVRARRRIPPGHCQKCGYDLTSNVSGRCPECGAAQ